MKELVNAMATITPDNRKSMALSMLLNNSAYVTILNTWFNYEIYARKINQGLHSIEK